MTALENVKESLRAVRSNLLRAILTIVIIAFGIMALVGIRTSIDGIKFWMTKNLSSLGSNTFRIQNVSSSVRRHGRGSNRQVFPDITFYEAMRFKDEFGQYSVVSITSSGNIAAQAKYKNRTTNANIQIIGTDENYLITANYKIESGRNLDPDDIKLRKNVVVIGQEIRQKLFPSQEAVGKVIQVDGRYYTIVGVFEEMGTSGSMGGDKICTIPVTTLRKHLKTPEKSYGINVYTEDPSMMEASMTEATGTFRLIRGLKPKEPENFSLVKSDNIVESLMESLSILTYSSVFIAWVTLFGASIALMNVMLVSVTERTREIGVRKALGATKGNVLIQFLTEAMLICQLGGLLGIVLGVLAGNLIGALLGNSIIVPWNWVFFGIAICAVVGIISGIYPAWKAAKIDPIEALRYE